MLISAKKDRIHVIDFSAKLFTFTPGIGAHIRYYGAYNNSLPAEQEQARIFSLAITLWELQNPKFVVGVLDFFAMHDAYKLTRSEIIQYITSKKMPDILNSPFFNTVLDAYECKLTKDQLKQACANLV
jgi:hypothetical protein